MRDRDLHRSASPVIQLIQPHPQTQRLWSAAQWPAIRSAITGLSGADDSASDPREGVVSPSPGHAQAFWPHLLAPIGPTLSVLGVSHHAATHATNARLLDYLSKALSTLMILLNPDCPAPRATASDVPWGE